MELVEVSDPSVLVPGEVSSVALDFKVLHPLVITRLGVFPTGPHMEIEGNVTVRLLQLEQQVVWRLAAEPDSRTPEPDSRTRQQKSSTREQ